MDAKEDDSTTKRGSRVFSSQEFMEFLATQAGDISKLEVTTRSGDRISASFGSAGDDSVFKSLDAMKSIFSSEDFMKLSSTGSGVSNENGKAAGPKHSDFTSREWSLEYARSHVDVTYDKCFTENETSSNRSSSTAKGPALPPKKRAGKTDWNDLYSSALSPLVEAAALASPQPIREKKDGSQNKQSDEMKNSSKSQRRKPRKVVPEIKVYVESYTDQDVLFGRGGRSNHHLGNKLYREKVTSMQAIYKQCDKSEKTKVAQSIVDDIHTKQNGRFLELCKDTGKYFIVPNIMARRKVGQALRENNTEEARAAKREKYGSTRPKKVGTSSIPAIADATAPAAQVSSAAI